MLSYLSNFIAIAVLVQSCNAIPISNSSLTPEIPTETVEQGWTSSPNGRGTIDIIWSCASTLFLCSWSTLCLQIPGKNDTRFHILWRRLCLTCLCGLGPEFTLQLALGQWSFARQSVRDFHAAGYSSWTMKHPFFANSGGFFLNTPDFKPIPIDAKQLLYLINKQYVKFPSLDNQDIDDKNRSTFCCGSFPYSRLYGLVQR